MADSDFERVCAAAWAVMGVLDDHTRALRELRQRDEELARLRTQWQAMKDETLLNQRECERLRSQLQSQAALAESLARDNDELRLKDKACNGR